MKKLLHALLVISCSGFSAHAVDLNDVQKQLQSTGVVGEVHGANHVNGLYVFTVRGSDFFDFINFSLYGANASVKKILLTLKRHDSVRIKGTIANLDRPQKHIRATEIEVVKAWDVQLPHREQQVVIPRDLLQKSDFIGKVHAISPDGNVLVVEYGDAVIPVPVDPKFIPLTSNLNRSDKVRVHFKFKSSPHAPSHLTLDASVPQPIEVLESVRARHGKRDKVEGSLVLFPKSPQVAFDVYALQADLGDGVVREYTLVNFESSDLFKKIREEAARNWNAAPQSTIVNARNKLLNPLIHGSASGTLNFIDPNQANPQILIDDLNDLQFSIK